MTKDEFEGWKSSRLTQEIFNYLKGAREYHQDMCVQAAATNESVEKIALTATLNSGVVLGLNYTLQLDWEDVGGTEDQ